MFQLNSDIDHLFLGVCINIDLRFVFQKIENGRFAKYRYFAHAKVNDSDFLMITKRWASVCLFVW